jgi:hypothetical protein
LGNGGFKWMEEDWRRFWKILTYNGNSSTPIPFIPLHSTNSQTSPEVWWAVESPEGICFSGFVCHQLPKEPLFSRPKSIGYPQISRV